MIELKGVSKSYGGSVVLHEIDLTIAPGRTTALIGPSGCGKSTLLRLMIGLVLPDAGSVSIAGKELTPATVLEVRHGLGYVIQDGGLFPHLNARDNVILMARYLGWETGRINDRLDQLAELTRFPHDGLDRFPAQLSGGQRQRVSLMRALMLDPKVILLDEPLGRSRPDGPRRASGRPPRHLSIAREDRRHGHARPRRGRLVRPRDPLDARRPDRSARAAQGLDRPTRPSPSSPSSSAPSASSSSSPRRKTRDARPRHPGRARTRWLTTPSRRFGSDRKCSPNR